MAYKPTVWEDYPSEKSPLSAANLNNIEQGIKTLETNKQNKLIPGKNITIDENNVISAPDGGGGSNVIANPQGEATDDLNKIGIDNVIYNVVGGSSGGNSTLLFSTTTEQTTMELSQPYKNFDYIYIEGRYTSGRVIVMPNIYKCAELNIGDAIGVSHDTGNLWLYVEDEYTFKKFGSNQSGLFITSIYGIKLSGGGGAIEGLRYTPNHTDIYSDVEVHIANANGDGYVPVDAYSFRTRSGYIQAESYINFVNFTGSAFVDLYCNDIHTSSGTSISDMNTKINQIIQKIGGI